MHRRWRSPARQIANGSRTSALRPPENAGIFTVKAAPPTSDGTFSSAQRPTVPAPISINEQRRRERHHAARHRMTRPCVARVFQARTPPSSGSRFLSGAKSAALPISRAMTPHLLGFFQCCDPIGIRVPHTVRMIVLAVVFRLARVMGHQVLVTKSNHGRSRQPARGGLRRPGCIFDRVAGSNNPGVAAATTAASAGPVNVTITATPTR